MSDINETTTILVKNITDLFLATLKDDVKDQVVRNIKEQMTKVDLVMVVRDHIESMLNNSVKAFTFPPRSISGGSISPDGLWIKADQIAGGTYRDFESTGIQDKATVCQVTILDEATVFENKLVSGTLEIAGDARIKGDLTIDGIVSKDSRLFQDLRTESIAAINGEMQSGILATFRDQVFTQIQTEGIDPSVIKIRGQSLIKDNNTLAPTVINSNLQRVGALRELQVTGETLLDETIYVSNHRVGVNTLDPSTVLDIWDQEVQVTVGKLSKDTAKISTPRNQRLIFGSNKQNNLAINTDGSVTVASLNIGEVNHTSAREIPSDNQPVGSIVWNAQPELGEPIGWVSLGGARWAKFGTITA